MHPILFEINGYALHSYGAFGALAFLIIPTVGIIRGRKLGTPPERIADLIFWTSLAGIAGARLLFILQNPGVFTSPADWVNLRTGGLVFYGAMLFGLPVGSLLMWRYKMPFFATWDNFATAMPIAHGVSRLGCFMAGCCHGLPTELPWGVTFSDPIAAAPHGIALHPTQLYEAALLFGIGAVVNVFHAFKRFDGQVMLLYLALYAAGRSIVEVYRGDASRGWFMEGVLGPVLTWSQGVSLLLALFAFGVFFVGAQWAKERGAGPAGPAVPPEAG